MKINYNKTAYSNSTTCLSQTNCNYYNPKSFQPIYPHRENILTMKPYIFSLFIVIVLILTHFGITDMKPLTDKEMHSLTGQSGIAQFNSVFEQNTEAVLSASDSSIRKKVFEEVFVKRDTGIINPTIMSFDEVFINSLGLDFTKIAEQNLNMNIKMEQINFSQAFSKEMETNNISFKK